MAVIDPVTGGVSNATNFFGKVSVGTIVGEYFATTVAPPGDPATNNTGVYGKQGYISNNINPVAEWTFYNVWVFKVGSPKFTTAAGDPMKMEVGFKFMDVDMPQYGGNAFTGRDWKWM